jgi:hypothetical protein
MQRVIEELTVALGNLNRHVRPPPQPFDPAVKTTTIDDFFRTYEAYASHTYGPKQGNSDSWLVALRSFLVGDAQHSLSAMSAHQLDYDAVKANLVSLFTPNDFLRTNKTSAFLLAQRHPGESFPVFSLRLAGLAAAAFGDVAGRDQMIMSKLMDSLPQELKVQVSVQLASMREPSLETVVQLITALEPFIPRSSVAVPVNAYQASAVRPPATNPEVNVRKTPNPSNSNVDASVRAKRCFKCNQTGHFIRNCPSRNESRQPMRTSPNFTGVTCQYCSKPGHVLAQCRDFKKEFGACIWCGSEDHKSFKCSSKPKGN